MEQDPIIRRYRPYLIAFAIVAAIALVLRACGALFL